ncbi:hypothetical protein B0H19DRAFT_972401, partial [Mycena capillaripes]
ISFPQPDSTRAAEALHLAVQRLREGSRKKSFFHWLPYIHLGIGLQLDAYHVFFI